MTSRHVETGLEPRSTLLSRLQRNISDLCEILDYDAQQDQLSNIVQLRGEVEQLRIRIVRMEADRQDSRVKRLEAVD